MNTQLLNSPRAAAAIMTIAVRIIAMATIAMVIPGCRPDQLRDEPAPADTTVTLDGISFRPDLPDGHTLDTVITAQMDELAGMELIVTSIYRDSITPLAARIGLLQVYTFDSLAGTYRHLYADTLRWGTNLRIFDMTGEGHPEAIVMTDGGGNDEIATRGMTIYSVGYGAVKDIFRADRGNPAIEFVKDGDRGRIVMMGQYWPPFVTHAEAIRYVDNYLVFRDGRFASIRTEQRERYVQSAQLGLDEYGRLREQYRNAIFNDSLESAVADTVDTAGAPDSLERVHPLFMPAARVIINFGRGGALQSLRSFWGSEREYLEGRLRPVEFKELEMLYSGTVVRF